jgi:hypothetical protein
MSQRARRFLAEGKAGKDTAEEDRKALSETESEDPASRGP